MVQIPQKFHPFLIVKFMAGQAYYVVNERQFLNASLTDELEVFHILSGNVYPGQRVKLAVTGFSAMPLNYQLDCLALNQTIRDFYKKNFAHTINEDMIDEIMSNKSVFTQKHIDTLVSLSKESLSELAKGKTAITPRQVELQELRKKYVRPEVNSESARSNWHQTGDLPKFVPTVDNQFNKQQQTTSMNLFGKIPGLNFNFGEVEKGLIALDMNGNLAFRTKTGEYVSIKTDASGNKSQMHVGSLKFDVPFYTLPTKELVKGDLIILDGRLLIVDEKPRTGGYKFIDAVSGSTTNKVEQDNILGMFFYSKVVSLFDMAGGQPKGVGLQGLNPMTMMLLSNSGNAGGGSDAMTNLLMFSQLSGGAEMTPQLMMFMMSQSGTQDFKDMMLPMMMMGNNGNGGGGMFGGLFGGNAAKKPAAKRASRKGAKSRKPAAKKSATRKTRD